MDCFAFTWSIKNISFIMDYPERSNLTSPVWKAGDKVFRNLQASNSDLGIEFRLVYLQKCPNIQSCKMFIVTSCGEVPMKCGPNGVFSIDKSSITDTDKKSIFYPKDTLTVGCRMRGETIKTGEYCVHSVLHKMRIQFITRMFHEFVSEKDLIKESDNVTFRMIIKKYSEPRTYAVLVTGQPRIDEWITFFDCKLSVKENKGRVLHNTMTFPIWMWSVEIFAFNMNENLRIELETIVAVHKESGSPVPGSLVGDLLQLYKNNTLNDATLNTEGKSFPAHKSILAARSSVFKAMFEKEETTESRSGVVNIEDVDSGTMEQMLDFLYSGSDNLLDVQWEEASKLYYAADKYDVQSLKCMCSNILKAGLTIENACDALVLADRHSDEELMTNTVGFIRKHDEVISSEAWEDLEENIPRLAAKVIRELYLKKVKK